MTGCSPQRARLAVALVALLWAASGRGEPAGADRPVATERATAAAPVEAFLTATRPGLALYSRDRTGTFTVGPYRFFVQPSRGPRLICHLPCAALLDPQENYFVDGPLAVSSPVLELREGWRAVEIGVRPGSLSRLWVAAPTLALGIASAVAAGGLAVNWRTRQDVVGNPYLHLTTDQAALDQQWKAAVGLGVVAAVAIAAGVAGVLLSRTHVTISRRRAIAFSSQGLGAVF